MKLDYSQMLGVFMLKLIEYKELKGDKNEATR